MDFSEKDELYKDSMLYKVAWLYYIDGLTQKEIAEKLDISQPTVSKVLKKLQEENLITSVKRGLWKLSKELMDVNGK